MRKFLLFFLFSVFTFANTNIENNVIDLHTFSQVVQNELKLNVILSQNIQDKEIYFYLDKDIEKNELLDICKRTLETNGLSFEQRKNYIYVTLNTDLDEKVRMLNVVDGVDKTSLLKSLNSILSKDGSSSDTSSKSSTSSNSKFNLVGNTLIFKSSYNDFNQVKLLVDSVNSKMLKKLQKNFLYKVLILETNLKKLKDFQTSFNIANEPTNNGFDTNLLSITQNNLSSFLSFLVGRHGFILKPESINFYLNSLVENGVTEILSNPELLIEFGKTASIQVGGTVRVTNLIEQDSKGNDKKIKKEKDVGLVLTLTPEDYLNNFITTKLNLNIENITGFDSDNEPLTSKKNLTTTLTIENNNTISLGGLYETYKSTETKKVPLLGDLPLLNYIFSVDIDKSETKILNILLTVEEVKN